MTKQFVEKSYRMIHLKRKRIIPGLVVIATILLTGAFSFAQATIANPEQEKILHNDYIQASFTDASSLPITNTNVTNTLNSGVQDFGGKLSAKKGEIIARLERHIAHYYAQGNKGQAKVEALEMRGSRIYARIWVRHHHVWDRGWLGKTTMYDITGKVELTFDPLNPYGTMSNTRICFDRPPVIGGSICGSARDIVAIIITLL